MNLKIEIPQDLGCEVVGYLYDSPDPADLGQTMVEVVTPTGVLIEAGWLPEGDPDGRYTVSATFGMKSLFRPFETTDIIEAQRRIESWARYFSGEPMRSNSSFSVTVEATMPESQAGNVVLPGREQTAVCA
jgi:hypothetical protein